MSGEVSYHPVPVQLIQERLLPYIISGQNIDDLVADAVHITKVRYRANAWGLGASKLSHDLLTQHDQGTLKELPAWMLKFDRDLYVWGRPFFITSERPDQVSRAVDAYLKATSNNTIDTIAREMLDLIEPGLVEQVEPDFEFELPDDAELARGLRMELDVFRAGFEAHASQQQLQLPTGELHDPGLLFEQHFAAAILRFAANFRPGWMSHGDVWPTYLMGTDDNQDLTPYVESMRSVFEPILEHVPHVAARLGNTIAAERLVGGYVPPDKVLDFRLFLDEHAECFSQKESQFDYKKILEAVNDAEREYMGFVEASTIYSASDGILN